jgi:capsular exopolysaccharide synthesis family protein
LPFPYHYLVFASLAGLSLPMVLVVFWERMIRRVSEPVHLERETQLAVVGEVARLPARRRNSQTSPPNQITEDIELFEESVDSLRTSLLLTEELQNMRVLTVTSAVSHEGKTSVAVSLAVSLARASGQPTLLIDGDMRSPDVHKLFEVPLEPGLAELLGGQCTADDVIVTTRSSSVHVLPAGKLISSPHQLLGNGAIRQLVEELRGKYRYIVIDTPPVLMAAETLMFTKIADTSLICAMRNITRGDQIRKACDRVIASGSRVAGAVLNGVPRGRYEYRRRGYHYSRAQQT